MSADAIRSYQREVERTLRSGLATEHSYRPALKGLIEALGPHVTATNDPKRVACGAPDYVVSRDTGYGPLTVGYVETKDVAVSLDETERSEQLRRYLPALENLLLTDYLEFRYFDGVPAEIWDFRVGGYQVCEKWLKDRRGRALTFEDITHYQKVVRALGETIRLMAEIDGAIEERGGWPLAGADVETDAATTSNISVSLHRPDYSPEST